MVGKIRFATGFTGLATLITALALMVGCSANDTEDVILLSPTTGANQEVVRGVLSAMEDLSSYHMSITPSPPEDDPLRATHFDVDFVAPDVFRMLSSRAEGDTREVCRTDTVGDVSSETCQDVLVTVTGQANLEAVWNSENIWFRECSGFASPCGGAWQELPKPATYAPSIGPPYADLPNWHLEALKGAIDIQSAPGQETNASTLHLQGRFNPLRVFIEAEKSFYGEESGSGGGGGCGVSISVDFGAGTSPDVEEECREREGDSLTERTEAYDLRPAPIDIWVSATDSTIQRILAVVPQPLSGDPDISVDVEYSQFNAVEIEIPPKE